MAIDCENESSVGGFLAAFGNQSGSTIFHQLILAISDAIQFANQIMTEIDKLCPTK
jgi:hypothetical protein